MAGIFNEILNGINEGLKEYNRLKEAEEQREFLKVKIEFDEVMNSHFENEKVFEEGCEILGKYSKYFKDNTKKQMEAYIQKYGKDVTHEN